jgi:phosphohistidine phosphatase
MGDGKNLYLMRHADSSWAGNRMSDFDRTLNELGQRDVLEIGRKLKANSFSPEILICSPAKRASQTMNLLIPAIGFPKESVVFDESIYEASVGGLLNIVQSLDDRSGSAMLIGHNPGISLLAGELCGKAVAQIPTCSILTIHIPSSHWNNAGPIACQLLNFDHPRKQS